MQKVLFVSRKAEGSLTKVSLFNDKPNTAVNEGLSGSVKSDTYGLQVGLNPTKLIPLGSSDETVGPVELVGKFAVEVDGEFIPHYFDADNLTKFFDSKNASGVGIEITGTTNLEPTP